MSLSSANLDAFQMIAQEKSFSRAAEKLNVTQSALSQRLQKLEAELGSDLLLRSSGGVSLTPSGVKLFQYCQARESLEKDFLEDFTDKNKQSFSGSLRVAGASNVIRSIAQPALANVLRDNIDLQLEFVVEEVRRLPELLFNGTFDFVLLDHVVDRPNIETYVLGHETYVMIRSKKNDPRKNTFLDMTKEDVHSQAFLKRAGERLANIPRSFMGDIYGILDGVKQGLGSAIVPRHLLSTESDVEIDKSWGEQKIPVVLHFTKQSQYSLLKQTSIEALVEAAEGVLNSKS